VILMAQTIQTSEHDDVRVEEEKTAENKRVVRISGDDGIRNYEASVSLDERKQIKNYDRITIFWEEENRYLSFDLSDTNRNNIFDTLTWIVPHLSNQTFIIEITDAEHLDSDRNFISNVYNEAVHLDNLWTEAINHSEYVRVWFEQNLSNVNDITIFARNNQSLNTKVDVYEFNTSNLLASFPNISQEGYYTILLTNLSGEDDKFDLRVNNTDDNSNAFLEFDYIVDPPEIDEFRNITGLDCPIGVNALSLQDTQGTQNLTIDINTEKVWNEDDSRNISGGAWRIDSRITTTAGGGQPNQVQAVIERRNSACVVQEEIVRLNRSTPVGTCMAVIYAFGIQGGVTFDFGDILTIRMERVVGARDNLLCYDNGATPPASFRTFLTHPANSSGPAPPPEVEDNVTTVIAEDEIFPIVILGEAVARASIPYAQQGEELNFTDFNALQLGNNFTSAGVIGLGPGIKVFEVVPNNQLNKTKEFSDVGIIELGVAG
ncbi:hypothetical protein LCGC14_1011810, partial [marine sediment metagenome]